MVFGSNPARKFLPRRRLSDNRCGVNHPAVPTTFKHKNRRKVLEAYYLSTNRTCWVSWLSFVKSAASDFVCL